MGATVINGEFEWDADKAVANLARHGVSFEEAATVLQAGNVIEEPDGSNRDHFRTIGFSGGARIITVINKDASIGRIRIISAWHATPAEQRRYNEG